MKEKEREIKDRLIHKFEKLNQEDKAKVLQYIESVMKKEMKENAKS